MAEEGFRLPASSYEEITKLIKAYGNMKEAAVPGQISQLTGQSPTTVSANNAFLVAAGIVEGGKKKIITEKGLALARALEHEMPEEISDKWRVVVLENDFFQKLLSAVKIRKGMDFPTLQAHTAYSAGQSKNKVTMTGAKAVFDILREAAVISEDSGKFTANNLENNISATNNTSQESTTSLEREPASGRTCATPIASVATPTGVAITIQVQIQCSPNDIDTLGGKLRHLIKELSNSSEHQNDKLAAEI